jgi:hypothetical protein
MKFINLKLVIISILILETSIAFLPIFKNTSQFENLIFNSLQNTGSTTDSSNEKLFESEEDIQDASTTLEKEFGAENSRFLEIRFFNDFAIVHTQETPKNPEKNAESMYRNGVSKPVPAQQLGDGKLEHNLFSLNDFKTESIPVLNQELMAKLKDIEGGNANRFIVMRNLPFDKNIRFIITADAFRTFINVKANINNKLKTF